MHILLTALLLLIVITRPIEDFMKLGGPTRVIAHRGFSGAAPENTLAAFEKAIEVGADMFELDVLLSRDGRVVVIHDDTLDRTTDGEGKVAAFTLAEIKKLDAGSWFSAEFAGERIPTLEEALRLAKGRILVNVEIKTEAVGHGVVAKALEIIDELDMKDTVVISSFNPTALAKARELDPDIRTASLFNTELQKGMSPEAVMAEVGSNGFNLSRRQVDAGIVATCHRLERPVAVYTVNEINEMERLIDLGVDAIFTDRPDRLLRVLVAP